MALTSNPSCRACASSHRAELDRKLLAGDSTRAVSAWLEREHGERIPFQAIAIHKAKHCNAPAEALARVEQAKVQLEAARPAFEASVAKITADVELLDELATMTVGVARVLGPGIHTDPSPQQARVFLGALKEAREAVVAKHELLHGKKVNVDGSITGIAEFLGLAFEEDAGAAEEPDEDEDDASEASGGSADAGDEGAEEGGPEAPTPLAK
jgi:hypothetical protein